MESGSAGAVSERAPPPPSSAYRHSPASNSARLFALHWLPVIVWMGVIFLVSNTSGADIDTAQTAFPDWLPRDVRWDWFVHPLEFGTLAVLARRLFAWRDDLSVVAVLSRAAALCLGYAVADEFLHQAFVEGRTASLYDVGLDALGALCGLALAEAWVCLTRERRRLAARPIYD